MEEIEEEDVDRGERAQQAALHDEQEHQVDLQPLGAGLQGVEAGGEPHDARQHEQRERDAVEAERQMNADLLQSQRMQAVEGKAQVPRRDGVIGRELAPQPQRDAGGHGEGHGGQLRGKPFGQAERDGQRRGQRRGDGQQEEVGIQGVHGGQAG